MKKVVTLFLLIAAIASLTSCRGLIREDPKILPKNIYIQGFVYDRDSLYPIKDATVHLEGCVLMDVIYNPIDKTKTDENGYFHFLFQPEERYYYRLQIREDDYSIYHISLDKYAGNQEFEIFLHK
ncbi:MAG: hypothetical protein PHP31_07025 [Lentimicrobiaceae bacterium]|nr:hypothetical protein [Lentimicrobiaceae bacterium]